MAGTRAVGEWGQRRVLCAGVEGKQAMTRRRPTLPRGQAGPIFLPRVTSSPGADWARGTVMGTSNRRLTTAPDRAELTQDLRRQAPPARVRGDACHSRLGAHMSTWWDVARPPFFMWEAIVAAPFLRNVDAVRNVETRTINQNWTVLRDADRATRHIY